MEARRGWLGAVTVLGNFGPVEEQPLGRAGAAGSAMLAASAGVPQDGWQRPRVALAVGGAVERP
jgi:hypothetical protein